MFSNQSSEGVLFAPVATAEASSSAVRVQTEDVKFKDSDIQTLQQQNAATQTTAEEKKEGEVDYAKLAKFLRRVEPEVMKLLDEIHDENAISEYESFAFKGATAQVKLLTRFSTLEENDKKKKISAVKWSKGGGTLAVAYSAENHETWCDHQSIIKLYEFNRHEKVVEKPSKTYEVNSCVTSLAYHLNEPSILAAGLSSGDVIVWNLADTSINQMQVCVHGDIVTSLLWRPQTIREPHLLISSSSDGYILFHRMIENFTNSTLDRRFKIVKEYNPAENSRPPSAGRHERATEAGLYITCLDFSLKNLEIFIVGTLCGGLYKCSVNATSAIHGDKTLIDPVIDEYERCDASIISIKCSPTADTFVASNLNKEIRIFNIHQAASVHTISMEYTIVGLQWYIDTRDIVMAYGANSTIKFYHATNGAAYSNLKIQSQSQEINCMDVMLKRDVIALADLQGNLEVWKIPKEAFFTKS